MAGAPTKGFPASLLYKSSHAAPRKGDKSSKPSAKPSDRSAVSELQRIASLRRGTATRQAAFRAARRRERSRKSKVVASGVPLLLLGSVAVPAIAWAAASGGPAKASPSAGTLPASTALSAFDGRPSPMGGDWSTQHPTGWAAPPPTTPPTTAAPAKSPPVTTGRAVVVSAQGTSLGSFVVTCYDLQGRTASGATTNPATVAVDPRVIPLGTHIYIDGAGERIAQDTGGAIVGKRLDIWEPTYAQCAAWGVETRQVWLG